MSPVIYKSTTGSSCILFGSGGETVPGDLLGISLPDFCNYIMGSQASVCPPSEADFIWKTQVRDKYGIFILFRDTGKGVIVPPVIVDVDRDGVDGIIVNSYGGFVMLLDGVNLRPIWTTAFNNMESYSTPDPDYFDDDDYINFMVHHNVGAWPFYSYSYSVNLDNALVSKISKNLSSVDTTDQEERCTLLQTYEFSTGAIADADGDGTLDYLSVVPLDGILVSTDSGTATTEYITRISKVNMFPKSSIMDRIHLNAATTITRNSKDRDIEEVGVFLPVQ